jgi:hypothetical protein
MHWIVKLHGFPAFQNEREPNDDFAILLNSLISHVPLNHYMAERGFDYLPVEDARAEEYMGSLREDNLPKPLTEDGITWMALHYSDVILSCSPATSDQLRQALGLVPVVDARVKKALRALSDYDLLTVSGSGKAARRVIKQLRLSRWGRFAETDNIAALRRHVQGTSS